MEIYGYIASVAIGISLGLIGGGGSILTVPVLVYLFNINPVAATAYSLFIVGLTSLAGVFAKYTDHLVSMRTAVIFGLPSIVTVFLTRKYIVPSLPDVLFSIGQFQLTKPLFIMLLFAVLMIAASVSMIRSDKDDTLELEGKQKFNYPLILLEGIVVGLLTGFVGAGGGFLIIPALVMLSKLPMKKAIGTSLVIISAKSLIGFVGDVFVTTTTIDWPLLLIITGLAIIGILIGNRLARKIDGEKLKRAFGWFVLAMGIYIILNEFVI